VIAYDEKRTLGLRSKRKLKLNQQQQTPPEGVRSATTRNNAGVDGTGLSDGHHLIGPASRKPTKLAVELGVRSPHPKPTRFGRARHQYHHTY
jgi:hypothetical protein